MGLDRIGSPPGRTVFAAVTRRWPRGPAGPYSRAARRRSSSRWRAIAGSRYECIDLGLSPGDLWGFRQPAVSAGLGEGDCLAVLPLARSPVRASALARTTSGSRGSGGRASCQGRSCRALGRWIRICCTVSHLPVLISPVSHPSRGANGGEPGPGGPALLGTVRGPAAVGRHPKVAAGWNVAVRRSVTRRCYTSMSWAMRWFDLPAASSRSTSRRLRPFVRGPGWRAAARRPARR